VHLESNVNIQLLVTPLSALLRNSTLYAGFNTDTLLQELFQNAKVKSTSEPTFAK
jgi:hypothetical protein